MSTPPTASRGAAIAAVIVAAALIAGAVVLALVLPGDDSSAPPWLPGTSSSDSVIPKRMTRAEMLAEYAEIAPRDSSATPETVDKLAGIVCGRLGQGTTTDTIITELTEQYQARATQVARLLVGYLCPQYLKDFR
jgi:hypothetical protein